ncbi:hypothetical protein DL768_011266 [Monosporascus sp. mg162]|nr:hypothetical protein DL768_011266 [Monosporascus sp. mg162]
MSAPTFLPLTLFRSTKALPTIEDATDTAPTIKRTRQPVTACADYVPDQHQQTPYSESDGADVLDGLEPHRDVMYRAEEARAEGELVDSAGPDGALDDTERDRGIVPYPPLDYDECKGEHVEHDKQRDDATALQFVCVAAPLKRKGGGPGAAATYKFFGESSAQRGPSYSSYSIRAAGQGAEQNVE